MKDFILYPLRELPDGTVATFFPFHISLEGAERQIFCRCDADYDAFVKIIAICARRHGAYLVMYAVVSNHVHCIIYCIDQKTADAIAEDIKKMCSMYFSRKYGVRGAMRNMKASAILIDSVYYFRNACAYDIRNAMDNGATSISEYKWTGYRAVFCDGHSSGKTRKVSDLSRREKEAIMHTNDDLSSTRWLLNDHDELEPVSICDWQAIEAAFLHDQAFFMKSIGMVNVAEMDHKLVTAPRTMLKDEELRRMAEDASNRWFRMPVHDLPVEKKIRLLVYISHVQKTTVPQLARVFELPRETIKKAGV